MTTEDIEEFVGQAKLSEIVSLISGLYNEGTPQVFQGTCLSCTSFLNKECMDARNYINYKFLKCNPENSCEYFNSKLKGIL